MLASVYIVLDGLFVVTSMHVPGDELENVIAGVRNEVKSAGMQETRENCWSFFIDRVRRQLKVSAYLSIYVYCMGHDNGTEGYYNSLDPCQQDACLHAG